MPVFIYLLLLDLLSLYIIGRRGTLKQSALKYLVTLVWQCFRVKV